MARHRIFWRPGDPTRSRKANRRDWRTARERKTFAAYDPQYPRTLLWPQAERRTGEAAR